MSGMGSVEFLQQTYLPPVTVRAMGISSGVMAESPEQPLPPATKPLIFRPTQPYLHDPLLKRILLRNSQPTTGIKAKQARDSALLTHNMLCKEVELSGIAALDGRKDIDLKVGEEEIGAFHQTIQEMGETAFDAVVWKCFAERQERLAQRFTPPAKDGQTPELVAVYHPILFVYAALERHVEALVMNEVSRL